MPIMAAVLLGAAPNLFASRCIIWLARHLLGIGLQIIAAGNRKCFVSSITGYLICNGESQAPSACAVVHASQLTASQCPCVHCCHRNGRVRSRSQVPVLFLQRHHGSARPATWTGFQHVECKADRCHALL
jgi:hypothetical protein